MIAEMEQEQLRRLVARNRLLKGWEAFHRCILADSYMTAEWKCAVLDAVLDLLPTPEEYDAAVWQPGVKE
ncbi:MAG TPA: hypothetical protein VF916_04560 [Ktedonobacterales bacterium]